MRIEKVNQQLKREISHILLQELGDPRMQFVSVTHVDTSKDLRNAKVYFSVLGKPTQRDEAEKGLVGARGLIRCLIGQRLNLRFTPELIFMYDQSIVYGVELEETFKKIHEEEKQRHKSDPAGS